MHHDLVDVLIIEDESELARLHAELVQKHPRLRLAGMAASSPRRGSCSTPPPQLVLLDNYLPDGKGSR
jgi:two-component system response regulator CitB